MKKGYGDKEPRSDGNLKVIEIQDISTFATISKRTNTINIIEHEGQEYITQLGKARVFGTSMLI